MTSQQNVRVTCGDPHVNHHRHNRLRLAFSLAGAILGPIFGAHLGRVSRANVDRPVDFAKIASSGVCQADADRHSGPRYVAANLATGLLNMAIRGYILGAISGPILDDFAAGLSLHRHELDMPSSTELAPTPQLPTMSSFQLDVRLVSMCHCRFDPRLTLGPWGGGLPLRLCCSGMLGAIDGASWTFAAGLSLALERPPDLGSPLWSLPPATV